MTERRCPLCDTAMEEGFMVDEGSHGKLSQQEWGSGKPQPSFWTVTKRPEVRLKITSFRCTGCGYLMDFADAETTS